MDNTDSCIDRVKMGCPFNRKRRMSQHSTGVWAAAPYSCITLDLKASAQIGAPPAPSWLCKRTAPKDSPVEIATGRSKDLVIIHLIESAKLNLERV